MINLGEAFAYEPQAGNITATLGPIFNQTIYTGSNVAVEPPIESGLSLTAVGDIDGKGSLEIATNFMTKVFVRESLGKAISESTQAVHISMGYRYWIAPSFSASLAFYSAYSMGVPKLEYTDFLPSDEMSTSAHDTTEYGFDFSLNVELWSQGMWGAVAMAQYSQSTTAKSGEDANHYAFLVGARYMLQEKKPVKAE